MAGSRPILTAFARSPDEGQGLARDMPVRWALEEVGRPYDVRLLSSAEMRRPEHLSRQPFGQIPTLEEGGLVLFESGAIVLHVANDGPGLLPDDADARARAIAWMFAAATTIQAPIVERETAGYMEADKSWHRERMAMLDERVLVRLGQLSNRLGDGEWLDGAFSAGDLMMVVVLRRLEGSGLVERFLNLAAYVARAETRPAYRRAFEAQRAVFLDAN